ncbi:YcaO-like family protein [Legionella dresdenensis]|uniref:YcaO-like family protein n=1 Tax=Legionella dresdenensis TaxID=450200 RepID=A0ABV8CGB4_9GAMM
MTLAGLRDFPLLPQCKANHASIQHAVKFKLCTESLLSAPKSAIIDGIISYGGSTSIGLKLPRKAYGEFHERNHLFTRVAVNNRKKLQDIQPASYRDKLLALCQLKERNEQTCLEHLFSWTTIYNLFDEQPQDYFYNAISLNCNKADSRFINFSDSCACAAHPDKQSALYNSLMEFLERQALLGSWLSKTYQYTINPEILRDITPYTDLVNQFLDNGELVIVQNGNKLPGHTVIIFYFAHSDDDLVKYSIGSSSGLTLEEALLSSFEELYQCYSFLYNAESSEGLEDKAGAGYHLEFQKCNYKAVRETIPFTHQLTPYQVNSLADLQQSKRFSYDEVVNALGEMSRDIYYYHAYNRELDLHYTKLISPDFFTHMALGKNLNVDNQYARRLGISPENAYMGKIPFP